MLLMDDEIAGMQLRQEGGGSHRAPLLATPLRPAKYLGIGEDGERQRAAMPALWQTAMHYLQRAGFGWIGQVYLWRDHDDAVVAEQRLIAEEFGQSPRLHAHQHHPLPLGEHLAHLLGKGTGTPAIRCRGGQVRRKRAAVGRLIYLGDQTGEVGL